MSDKSEGKEFAGFSIPEKNYFPMPNNWTDICAEIDNLSELKVIQYIIRHTWGYQEYGGYKTISVDEFMHGRRRQDRTRMDNGTGLSEPSVKDGLKRAIKHGYLVCITDEKDKGRVKKSYGLKMHEGSERGKKLTGQETYPVTNLSPEVKELTPRGQKSYPRTEKDTIERHLEKNKESVSPAREDTHPSFSNSSSSEQVAEQSAPTQQARSRAEAATSSAPDAPRTPDSPPVLQQGVRGVFPPDTNVVDSPPADDKAQVNSARKPGWEALLDYWDSKYGASPRPKWVIEEAKDLMKRMKPTREQVDKVCAELKARKKPITFETMYNNWHLLKEVEEREQAKTNAVPKSISGRRRVENDPGYAEYMAAMMKGEK